MKNLLYLALPALALLLPSAQTSAQVVLEKATVSTGAVRASNATTTAELTLGQPVTGYATDGRINGSFGFWHDAFVVSSVGVSTGAGAITALHVAPNPASDRALVRVVIARAGHVDVTLHDQAGRQVAALYSGERAAGELLLPIDPSGLPAGTYHIAVQSHGALLQGSVTIVR